MSKKITTILKSIFILVIFSLAVKSFAVWMPPTQAPTGGNTPSPIHVGSSLQEKIGSFIVRGFRVLDPTNANTTLSIFDGQIQLKGGAPELNKILVATANTGVATWKTLAEITGGGGSNMTNPMTTLGDMIYGIAGGVPTRLPIGSADQVLTVVNGIPTWQTLSGGGGNSPWLRNSTTQTVVLGTSTDFVGIGTPTPSQQLEITKNMKIPPTSGGGAAGVIFMGDNRFLHTAGVDNIFLGKNAGNFSVGGDFNTGVGTEALFSLGSGRWNTAVGASALRQNTGGSANTAVGREAAKNNNGGGNNVALGYKALFANTGGGDNTAVGANSLSNATGGGNTAVGFNALDSVLNGSGNTALGYNADVCNSCGAISNATAIGANARVDVSSTMVFGDTAVVGWGFGTQPNGAALRVGSTSSNGNGAILTLTGTWQGSSDRTKKHNIETISYGLGEVMKLNPVSFDWNGTNEKDIGFIAQEVKEIIPEVVSGKEGSMTMSYGNMTAVLTKAVQELKEENDALKARIEVLKNKLDIE